MPFMASFLIGKCVNKRLKFYCSLGLIVNIGGCALFGGSSSHKKSGKNSAISVPKVTVVTPPVGNDKNWRYLGLSDDGQLIDEINDSSIKPTDKAQIYNYQDRKTVTDINKFTAYTTGQPHYKFLLSNWQMDCNSKQYLILNTTLYDSSAIEQLKYDYTTDNSVKWVKIGNGSLAQLQYNYICLNQKRNLGY